MSRVAVSVDIQRVEGCPTLAGTFNNGEATVQFISPEGSYVNYRTMRSINVPTVYLTHKYYAFAQMNPNSVLPSSQAVGFEYAGCNYQSAVEHIGKITNDAWNNVSFICQGSRDGNGIMYAPYVYGKNVSGLEVKIKNILYIDLTLMFGEGREPETTDEFEALCRKNGIDFNSPYPMDSGTRKIWRK